MKTENDSNESEETIEVKMPKFLRNWHPKYVKPEWDEFRNIPIEDLFDEVHEHIRSTETKEGYIL
jgi:hypothetical protein